MKLKILILALLIVPVSAQFHNTVPPDHWIYESIERLQIAGYFRDLQQGARPYTRQQIAESLQEIDKPANARSIQIELDRLRKEFRTEITLLKNEEEIKPQIKLGTNMILNGTYKEDFKRNNTLRIYTFLNFGNNLGVKYAGLLNDQLGKDENYIGDEWRDMSGYQEQVYALYSNPNFNLKFGRDYVKWGYGKKGQLLISDNSRSFDMISLKTKVKRLNFQSIIAKLDNMNGARRYLSAVRFEFNPVDNLYLAIAQAGLFGGPDQELDFALANPFAFSYGTIHNDPGKGSNAMVYFDATYYLHKKYRLYGDLLIDDYQADSGTKGTLEPNEIGFTIGTEFMPSKFLPHGWLEFTQIRNRTYNTPAAVYEKFVHRNESIGYPQTDLRRFNLHLDKWINSKFNLIFEQDLLQKGEGTILGEFTTPYMDENVTVEEGYTEKIPYGTVETTSRTFLGCKYFVSNYLNIEARLGYENIDNLEHVQGTSESGLFVEVKLWFDGSTRF